MGSDTLLLAGHSHTIALGCETTITPDGMPLLVNTQDNRFFGLAGSADRDELYLDEIVKRAKNHVIVIIWRGDQHYVNFLFRENNKFDFFLSSEPHRKIEAPLIAEEAVLEYFRNRLFDLDKLLKKLADANVRDVIVCGTPPPKNDDAFIRNILAKEIYWRELASLHQISFDNIEITPPSIMYKLWAASQIVFEEQASKHGFLFAPVPRSVTTEDGYLRSEFWGDDLIHAWGNYGSIMRDYLYNIAVNAGWITA